jgi:hypothetical protein
MTRFISARELLLAIVLYGALAAAAFWPTLTGDEVFFPIHTDLVNPWRATTPQPLLAELEARANLVTTDKLWLFHPDNQVFARAVHEGRVPLWNPAILSGAPYLGQLLCPVFYPPYWLLAVTPNERMYGWLTALHFALAALFAHLFARRLGLSLGGALISGVAFGFAGPMWTRAHYYMTFFPIVWLPLLLLLVDVLARDGSRAARVGIAIVAAVMVLAGFPQMAIYGFYLAALYALLRGRLRDAAMAGAMIGLGIMLAGVQLVPAVRALMLSDRGMQTVASLDRNALSPYSLVTLVWPHAFGDPSWPLDTTVSNWFKAAFLPLDPSYNFTETTVYAGILPLLLAVPALRDRRGRELLGLAGLLLFVALLPLGLAHVLAVLPGLSTGDPRRTLLPAAGLIGLAAGVGWDALPSGRHRTLVLGIAGAVAAVSALIAVLLTSHGESVITFLIERMRHRYGATVDEFLTTLPASERTRFDAGHIAYLRGEMWRTCLLAASAFVVVLVARRPWLVALAVAAIAVDLVSFGVPINRGQPAAGFMAPNPLIERLEQAGDKLEAQGDRLRLMRFVGESDPPRQIFPLTDTVLTPNMGTHFGLDDSSGYITQVLTRYGALFDAFETGTHQAVRILPFQKPRSVVSALPVIGAFNVLLTTTPLERVLSPTDAQRFERIAEDRGYLAYMFKDALPRVTTFGRVRTAPDRMAAAAAVSDPGFDPHAEVVLEGAPGLEEGGGALPVARLVSYTPERVEIALAPGRAACLYLADAFYPGWEALVDGEPFPIYPANVAYRAVLLPAGAKSVVFRYRPGDFALGIAVSLAALALLGLIAWRGRRRSRAEDTAAPAAA